MRDTMKPNNRNIRNVPPKVWRAFRAYAATQGLTLAKALEKLLTQTKD